MESDPIRDRLLRLLRENRTDLKNASRAVGRNAAYLHQFVHRGTPRILPEDVRERLARLLGVDDAALRHEDVPRRGRAPDHRPVDASPTRPVKIGVPPTVPVAPIRQGPAGRRTGSVTLARMAVPEGFAAVAEVDVRASAGPGVYHDGPEDPAAVWLFPEAVVRHEFRARPGDLRIITIDGDSMEPLLSSGDRILVDTRQRVPVPPGIFVIWDGMGIVAKRVEHTPNSDPPALVIRSINPEYTTYERMADEVNIIGRVVWTAKRL